jgi:hypothetical protein
MIIEIFKAGTWTDSAGNTRTWTKNDLDEIVRKYNEQKEHEAPVVIGHPKDNTPAYGWVERLERRGSSLWAKIKPTVHEFIDWVKQGLYKKVSISLYPDLTLRHIGFLGAVPPAVKGLKAPEFSEGEFIEYQFREWTAEEREKLAKGEIKGEFAGPDKTFPIASCEDVADAWRLAGHADNPDEVRRNIIKIVRKFGWEDCLPETAKKWAEINMQEEAENMEEKLKELEKKLEEKERELAEYAEKLKEAEEIRLKAEEQIRKIEAEKRKQDYDSFCEELINEGRLTPAMKSLVMDFMEILSSSGEYEFSEGKGIPVEKFKNFLKGLPRQVEFSEVATKDKAVEGKEKKKDIKDMSGWELAELYKNNPQEFSEIINNLRR